MKQIKSVILHIGNYKTGSTYLQKKLSDNANHLKDNFGIIYPDIWKMGMVGQHELINKIKNRDADIALEVKKMQESGQALLFSSENFTGLDIADLTFLKSCFHGDSDFQIYFVNRKPESLIPSFWREMIKHGKLYTLHEFLFNEISKPFQSRLINADIFLSNYTNVFGKPALHIIDYDLCRNLHIDLYQQLLGHAFGLKSEVFGDQEEAIVNSSISGEYTELLRLMNLYLRSNNTEYEVKYRNNLIKTVNKNTHPFIFSILSKNVKTIEVDSKMLAIDHIYSAVLKKYESNFVRAKEQSNEHSESNNKDHQFEYVDSDLLCFNTQFIQSIRDLFEVTFNIK